MSDERLVERVARFRPVGPPVDLRARIIRTPSTRAPWGAIAALLFVTLTLRILASAHHVALAGRLLNTSSRERLVQKLGDRLGGDPLAYDTARTVIESSDPGIGR